MVKWFGKSWGAPICEDAEHVGVPYRQPCAHCEEPIDMQDSGVFMPHLEAGYSHHKPYHLNCFLRGTTGSVAHIERRCSCFVPGAIEGDPPGMTKRQAADAAVALWEKLNRATIQ